jgi:hypothetical protein
VEQVVHISTPLATDLKNLLHVLDLPDLDVERSLLALRYDVRLSVASFVGLTLSVVVAGQRVTLTSVDESKLDMISSSLAVPVSMAGSVAPGAELVLYASNPGAFVDLAADLTFALHSPSGEIRVDEHLDPGTIRSGLEGVEEMAMVSRATGVLIGRGLTPEEAREHLERKAQKSGLEVFQVAAYLLSTTE